MNYEFRLFDEIIQGNLSPITDQQQNAVKYIASLQERHNECYNIVTATIKKNKAKFVLQESKTINSLHPLAKKVLNSQYDLFQNMSINELSDEVLKSLNLNPKSILSVVYQQQSNATVLHIKTALNWNQIEFKEAKYYFYNDLLKAEVIRIKEIINNEVFLFTCSEKTEHYIHKLQQALVSLCFKLIKLLDFKEQNDIYKPAVNFSNSDILNLTFISLEELLRFFEKNFLNYIDQNIYIPHRCTLVKMYNINEKLEAVKITLLNSNINSALLQIIYIPFLKLSAIKLEERMSYKELIYLNTYLQAFYDEIKENNNSITEPQINELLYRINFNAFDMQLYKIALITREIEAIDLIHEKIDYLYHRLKIVNQRRCKVNIAFDPTITSLKDQVTGWLEEEINYYNKRQSVQSKQQSVNLFSENEKVKIEMGLSVAQLALFTKLQVDVGIITHKVQQDIFNHVANSFQTSNAADISQGSIKNKYYNYDSATLEVLKQKIIEMLNHLKCM